MIDDDLKEDDFFTIDLNELERLWCEQPQNHYDLCMRSAEARDAERRAKGELELVYAEVDHQVRLHPDQHGIHSAKATEVMIEGAVKRDSRYKTALSDHIKTQHDVDVCAAAVSASEHKKKGMEVSASLLIGGFWAAPRARGEAGEKMSEAEIKRARKAGQQRRVEGSRS